MPWFLLSNGIHLRKNLSVLCKMTWLVLGGLLGPEKQSNMYNTQAMNVWANVLSLFSK